MKLANKAPMQKKTKTYGMYYEYSMRTGGPKQVTGKRESRA
jgi:hypothetical protein